MNSSDILNTLLTLARLDVLTILYCTVLNIPGTLDLTIPTSQAWQSTFAPWDMNHSWIEPQFCGERALYPFNINR